MQVVSPWLTHWNYSSLHYDDIIMGDMAWQITSFRIVYSTIYSGADQSKHQCSASLAFLWGIHRGPVNSPHKWPVTRKIFPFDDVIMVYVHATYLSKILNPWLIEWKGKWWNENVDWHQGNAGLWLIGPLWIYFGVIWITTNQSPFKKNGEKFLKYLLTSHEKLRHLKWPAD